MKEITLDKVMLTQEEYQDMLRSVAKLRKIGVTLDYTVSKPNHKRVAVKFNQQYDLEALCKQVGE
jgi:hypothetical protein|tara:strand:- start:569 stop:763 length:195 start_codon:yes stop_codon:yes gene_type:complete